MFVHELYMKWVLMLCKRCFKLFGGTSYGRFILQSLENQGILHSILLNKRGGKIITFLSSHSKEVLKNLIRHGNISSESSADP